MRRVGAICCLALALLTALAAVESMTATVTVVVAIRALTRGDTILADDLTVMEMPAAPAFDGAFSSTADAAGLVVQSDVGSGQPLYPTMARASPVAPDGHGVLEVAVANDASSLIAGDTVMLVSAVGCGQDEPQPCVLAEEALVMTRAEPTREGASGSLLTVAMPPEELLKVMSSAQLGAIVTVNAPVQ